MSYPVPRVKGDPVWDNNTITLPSARLREALDWLDVHHPKGWIGTDYEATGLNCFDINWQVSGMGLGVRTGALTGKAFYIDFKYPNQVPKGDDLAYLQQWMLKHRERLMAFNCSYEYQASIRALNLHIQFRDARAISTAAHVFGSLKRICQTYCGAHDWEVANSELLSLCGVIMAKLQRSAPEKLRQFRERYRLQCSLDVLETDLTDFYTAEEISWFRSQCDFDRVKSLIQIKRDARKAGVEPVMPYTNGKGETVEVPLVLTGMELTLESAVINGLTLADVMVGAMYDPSSGWGSVPTRSLAPYCGWDCFYTVVLADTFLEDERLANCFTDFEHEIHFSGVLTSYGIGWDDNAACILDASYLRIGNDSLAELCSQVKPLDDEYGNNAKMLALMSKGWEPFTYQWAFKTGGPKHETVNAPLHLKHVIESDLAKLEAIIAAREPIAPTASMLKNREAMLTALSSFDEVQEGLKTVFADPRTSEFMVDTRDNGKVSWKLCSSYEELMKILGCDGNAERIGSHCRIKYKTLVDHPFVTEYKEVSVADEEQRLEALKRIFNPGSNVTANVRRYWDAYLTPMTMTANLFYGIQKSLEASEAWEYVAGWLVESDEQALDKKGELKFDDDGDPVMKKVLVPKTIEYICPETGNVLEFTEILVDKTNLRETLAKLNGLHALLPASVPLQHVYISDVRKAEILAKPGGEWLYKALAAKSDIATKATALRRSIRAAIDGMTSYIEVQTGGFKAELIELQHAVHVGYLGVKLKDPTTWSQEYKMIMSMRLHKKTMKNRSTYVIGDKLGRGAVSITEPLPEGLDFKSEEGILHISENRQIREHYYYSDTYSTELRSKLSDNGQMILGTDFNPCSAETRRWRSRNHTVPASSELRRCYIPRHKEWILDHSDFSGMELATVAAIAMEMRMIQAFLNGEDIHMVTASGVWNLPKEQITPMMRRYAKICTFLILYGGELPALAAAIGGSMVRAKEIMEGFYQAYPELRHYIFSYRKQAKELGYVYTINGAPLNIDRDNLAQVGTTAINYPIQSSASMVGANAFKQMWSTCQQLRLPMLVNSFTHDSLDQEAHPAAYFSIKPIMKYCAEVAVYDRWKIPARLDGEAGVNQYDLCGTKVKSSILDGSEEKPHIIMLDGAEEALDMLVAKFDPWYEIQIEKEFDETIESTIEELWIARRAFNISMTEGKPVDTYKYKCSMVKKTNLFLPDMANPIYQKIVAAGL